MRSNGTAEERFWAKVDFDGPEHPYEPERGACWIWTASSRRGDYGQFGLNGRNRLAHRLAYEWLVAPLISSVVLCHSCDRPRCVNPWHMFEGTHAANAHDKHRKGRDWQSQRTHCPQGHPYVGDNLYIQPKGRRECYECRRTRARARVR